MDQQSTYIFPAIKGFSGQGIHRKRVAVLGPDAIAYSTLTKYQPQR
jgi:hypothetical protein